MHDARRDAPGWRRGAELSRNIGRMGAPANDLTALPATALVNVMQRREVSIRDVVMAFLDRIESHDRALGAFVHLDRERLLAEAGVAEGRRSRRPLHGLPIAVKDIFDVAGMPTTGGSALPTRPAATDSEVVRRLRDAGAIIVGKLTTSEFGCGSPHVLRQPRNPWSREHVAGGSSAGSAIAVAARMLPAAVGGDTGGSVRIPASFCGVVGFRPTSGTVSVAGSFALAPGLDIPGPMARSVGDAELLLGSMGDGLDPVPSHEVARIAWLGPLEGDGVDPEVAAVVEGVARGAAHLLRGRLQRVSPAALGDAWAGAWTLIYSRALTVYRPLLIEHLVELSRPFRWKLCAAAALNTRDSRAAAEILANARDEFARLADGSTVVVMPATSHPANRVDRRYAGRDTMEWTAGASIAGSPAIVLPVCLSRSGLPIAVQLVGAPGTDLALLRFAGAIERDGLAGATGLGPVKSDVVGDDAILSKPVESAPDASISNQDVEEIRDAVRRIGIPELEEGDAAAAARSLSVVREALHHAPRA
jgi:aspartyl-tRNA(Asn)/glutamyl-tRNA(Gln) amidotransferase subunit A